jgi:hypothetical protein
MVATQSKKRRDLVEAFSATIHRAGAWLTSAPGQQNLRFECLTDSTLPGLLTDAGHILNYLGQGERLVPAATSEVIVCPTTKVKTTISHPGIKQVAIYDILLPKDKYRERLD